MSIPQANKPPLTRFQKVLRTIVIVVVVLIGMFVVFGALSAVVKNRTDMQNGTTTTYADQYAVKLDSSSHVVKLYGPSDLATMTKAQRTSKDLVWFHDSANFPTHLYVPTTITVDDKDQLVTSEFSLQITSKHAAITAYNAAIDRGDDVTIRGYNATGSNIEEAVTEALTKPLQRAIDGGNFGQPTVVLDGTDSTAYNKDIAAAYNAGVSPTVLIPTCISTARVSMPCPPGAQNMYNFGCRQVGGKYTDWKQFIARFTLAMNLGKPNVHLFFDGEFTLNTPEPCKVTMAL